MRRRNAICAAAVMAAMSVAMAATAAQSADGARQVIKAGSIVEFRASATFTKVVGVFERWKAELKIPGNNFENASLRMELAAASVTTGSGLKDKEIKGKKFFAVEEYPTIQFMSKSVRAGDEPGKFAMDGELTMRGITKPVTVMVTVLAEAGGREWVDGDLSFNRREFGMTHNVPFNKVADTVSVMMHLELASGDAGAAAR